MKKETKNIETQSLIYNEMLNVRGGGKGSTGEPIDPIDDDEDEKEGGK